jgi:nicotinamide phosphoribosyltransferase
MRHLSTAYDNQMILQTDSYKLSHWLQYPPGMTWAQFYLESRGGEYETIVFFGLQYILKLYLSRVPSIREIAEAQNLAALHGLPFNRAGWERIHRLGYLPLRIYSVTEGSKNATHDVLMTIESTDSETPWIASWVETMLLKVWYPCTVATKAFHVRQIIEKAYLDAGIGRDSAEFASARFAYHNFGDRGSSSVETAAIGGAAHLTQFRGTDNFASLQFINDYYGVVGGCAGFSIPAAEHSTVTAWGEGQEHRMIETFIDMNRGRRVIACVLDSYDLLGAVKFCCALRQKIESEEYPTLVMRPDSGDPLKIIPAILEIMRSSHLSFDVINGFVRFSKYRIIWGDGITPSLIEAILKTATNLGYSPENFTFGSGGDLMQKVDRDTCQFAIKCCAVRIGDSIERPVYKKTPDDPSKASKGGTKRMAEDQLRFLNGALFNPTTFDDIRSAS